ncbi:general substrate transporter, partial [Periconia macrospinosa]
MVSYLGLRGAPLAKLIIGTMGLCFLCFGYAQGVLGGLLTVPAFLEQFSELDLASDHTAHRSWIIGAVTGTWNLGCFVSAVLTIFLGDYLGRKKTMMLGLIVWVIGELVQCTCHEFAPFVAGRFIAGFGNGFTTAAVPAYQAECVKSHRKGTILMIGAGGFITLGLALSYWFVFGMGFVTNSSATWRVPIAVQISFAVVAFVLLIFLPESPRWLILTGREDEALRVLSALNDKDIEGPEIRDEFLQIKDGILIMTQGSTSSLRSNKEKRNAHRVILAYFVQVFQQLSGINLSLQYLAIMFAVQLGFTGYMVRLMAACAATEYFLSTIVTVVGIDRFWGRRSLMMFGAAGMSLCMVLLAILLYLYQTHGVHGTQTAGTVFLFGFSTFFGIGWQGMAWLYPVEIVPLRIRGPANALSTSGNSLFNFLVVFTFPIAIFSLGWRTYIIFSCTNAAIVPLVYYFYPETACRSLEEVDMLFHLADDAPGNPWLNVVRISKEQPLWYGKNGEVPFEYEKSEWHQ